MKACVASAPGPVIAAPFKLTEISDPEPNGSNVLVRVQTCGVCRTDLHVIEGELPWRKSPIVPGHQVVGTIAATGKDAKRFPLGTRVGVAWLHRTCGVCRFCSRGAENLCEAADFTGYSVDGGYAEYVLAPEEFIYALPDFMTDVQAAPLLCAGIIGYRCLRHAGVPHGGRLGIYGFGAAGHVTIQVANYWGMSVYVCTRDQRHRRLASELGAVWVGAAADAPPVKLDGAIIFAPAGELVVAALRALDKAGTLVLGGIHMSDTPPIPYDLLYHERMVRSVANNTRQDGREFIELAAQIPVRTSVQLYPLAEANRALQALKNDAVHGAAALKVDH